jgi:LuxR family transcriptional regulator, maltose regulon positive regulatory protein
MRLGREHGYVNSQIWVPPLMARLCARALDAGIETDYVRDLVRRRRLVCDPPPVEVEAWPWAVRIFVLGRFVVRIDDRPLAWTGKVPRKPLALLKVLVVHGPGGVREALLMDRLWPEADGDAARRALTTALFRLRRLLGRDAAVLRANGEIALNPALCWVDLWAAERLLDNATAVNPDRAREGHAARWIERASALYRGPIVGPDEDEGSAAMRDARLRRRLQPLLPSSGIGAEGWE